MLKPDEDAILFPLIARQRDDRLTIQAHAVLFQPKARSLKRRALVRLLARAGGFSSSDLAKRLFHERLAAFLVDNKRRRCLQIQIGSHLCTLGPSAANGHMTGSIEIPCDDRPPAARFTFAAAPHHVADVHILATGGLSVIVDVDDTIKHSNVADIPDLLRNTFLRRYRPISEIRSLLCNLAARGATVHYVSASPWQLFVPLQQFVQRAGLPRGTFHLKVFRLKDRTGLDLIKAPDRFKLAAIEELVCGSPDRRFVLIGDSGERDPEIYAEVCRRCPDRIAHVFIRDVAPGTPERCRQVFKASGVNWSIAHAKSCDEIDGLLTF